MRRISKAALIMGGLLALSAAAASAMDSGGGGGMSPGSGGDMPSASTPRYDPAAEYAKAVQALQSKDYKMAARALEHVVEAAPKDADSWKLLGGARANLNDWKASRRAYERAAKLAPDDVAVHAGLGVALANLKDNKAQAELDWLTAKAKACADTCADAATLKSMTSLVQSALSPASGAPKPSAMLSPPSMLFAGPKAGDAAYVQAIGLVNEHRYDDALASLAAAKAVFGPHPDIITMEGYAWRKKGQYDRAESYYRQALAIAPVHRGATEYYGELKVERGDTRGAKLLLAKLDAICAYGCAEAEELRRWIDVGGDPQLR